MQVLPGYQEWKGIGRTKDECRTYKKEKKDKTKAKKAKAQEDHESGEEGVTVCMIRVLWLRLLARWVAWD